MTSHLPPRETPARERELFLACLELAPGELRRRYLAEACGADHSLRRSVESLLGSHQADGFLERPAIAGVRPAPGAVPSGPALGSFVGPYRLLAEIGAGGCGIVFEAEQETPVRRRVALKVIKPGMDSRAVIARFEAERQALASLEHPHIARVLDAGTLPTGQPYFVMERVHGTNITQFCHEHALDLPARLRLFLRVAAAVQHAHERGIIHRDLKPSNILVTQHDGEAWPQIIDFGLAKAIGPQSADHSTLTVPGSFLGTPAYMSPEQADLRMDAIDARTDVYSLGALLYELITGRPPFDPKALLAAGLEVMRKTIREQDPVPPSVRRRQVETAPSEPSAQSRPEKSAPPAHHHSRDLDWIVLKSLEKDRARRFTDVAAFAADIRRMLADEPISARPPGPLYRFGKLIRRNRLAFATVSAFLVPLSLGLGLTWWQAAEKQAALDQLAFGERERKLQLERTQRALRDEAELRNETVSLGIAARHQAYAGDLNLAHQALAGNNLGRATDLLDRQRPEAGQTDLRGWEWRYLWQKSRSEASFTLGHATNAVSALTVSVDGRWLAATEDHAVNLWRTDQRGEAVRWPTDRTRGPAVLSPDGAWFAQTTGSGREPGGRTQPRPEPRAGEFGVVLRDVVTGTNATAFSMDGPVLGFAFSPDSRQLLALTVGGGLLRWEIATRRLAAQLALEPARAFGATFACTPDLQQVAYATRDDHLAVFSTENGQRLWRSPAPVRDLRTLRLSPAHGQLVATAGPGAAVIRRWNLGLDRELPPLTGHTAWVADAAFSHDGSRLATASADQTVRLWDTATGEPLRILRGHRREVWSVVWSNDDLRLFSGSKEGTINVWEPTRTNTGPSSVTVPAEVRAWSFMSDPPEVVTLDREGQVHRWDGFRTNAPVTLLKVGPVRFGSVFSPDGRLLAGGNRAGGIRVWDLTSGSQLCEIGSSANFLVPLALSRGSSNLITLQPRERLYTRWHLATGKALESWPAEPGFRGFTATATDESGSASGPRFLSVSAEGVAAFRQWGSGPLHHLDLGLRQINGATLAPDGSSFAVSSGLGRAALWQLDPPRRLAEFGGFLLGTHGVGFSPDGRRLAVASLGREAIKLFDSTTAQELLTLEAGDHLFTTVRFSADERWLGASSPDGTLKLWHAPAADEITAAENPSR